MSGGSPPPLSARVAALMASFAGPKLWLDPWDKASLFQDSAGTTPVNAAGDPIGRIMDKSGAGNHATQATTTSRPLWQTAYAAFDGVDDSWATAPIDFTSTDKVTVIAGLRKLSDAAAGVFLELSSNVNTNNGSFYLTAPNSASSNFGTASRGTLVSAASITGWISPVSVVMTAELDIAAPLNRVRMNGAVAATNVVAQGTGTFGNYPLNISRRNNASSPFNGNLYGLIIIGRLLSPDELLLCERYMAQQAGIVLP